MKTFELEGKGREIVARSADQKRALKAMRKNNEIPAVLYGGEKGNSLHGYKRKPFVSWFTLRRFSLLS